MFCAGASIALKFELNICLIKKKKFSRMVRLKLSTNGNGISNSKWFSQICLKKDRSSSAILSGCWALDVLYVFFSIELHILMSSQ